MTSTSRNISFLEWFWDLLAPLNFSFVSIASFSFYRKQFGYGSKESSFSRVWGPEETFLPAEVRLTCNLIDHWLWCPERVAINLQNFPKILCLFGGISFWKLLDWTPWDDLIQRQENSMTNREMKAHINQYVRPYLARPVTAGTELAKKNVQTL